jgi:hypothetical protein
MKRLTRLLITLGLSLALALFAAAITYSTPSQAKMSFTPRAFFLQETPTPQEEDLSEIGSTDEIIVMSGVIVFIVIVPILLRHKSWR